MSVAEQPLRIVLADDHAIVRSAIRCLLEAGAAVGVAEAGDLEGTSRAVIEHRPDVLVMEIALEGASTVQAMPRLLRDSPHTRVVVLTMQSDAGSGRAALEAGAAGYVLKKAPLAELLEALRAVAAGGTYVSPALGARLAVARPAPHDELTGRERAVFRLLALGHTNGEIAEHLFLSRRTVEVHRASLQRKLCMSTRAELTRHALEHNLIAS